MVQAGHSEADVTALAEKKARAAPIERDISLEYLLKDKRQEKDKSIIRYFPTTTPMVGASRSVRHG
jgi:hypothetical protein